MLDRCGGGTGNDLAQFLLPNEGENVKNAGFASSSWPPGLDLSKAGAGAGTSISCREVLVLNAVLVLSPPGGRSRAPLFMAIAGA